MVSTCVASYDAVNCQDVGGCWTCRVEVTLHASPETEGSCVWSQSVAHITPGDWSQTAGAARASKETTTDCYTALTRLVTSQRLETACPEERSKLFTIEMHNRNDPIETMREDD